MVTSAILAGGRERLSERKRLHQHATRRASVAAILRI